MDWVTALIVYMRDRGHAHVEPTPKCDEVAASGYAGFAFR